MSGILEEDFDFIFNNLTVLDKLEYSSVLITGATGFLGSLFVKLLDYLNKKHNMNITILALIRDQDKALSLLGDYDVKYVVGDICNLPGITEKIDYIIHCAAITKSKEMMDTPVEVIEGIVSGTNNILKLAQEKQIKSMVYLSSMEVYGKTDPSLELVTEEDLGYVELPNVRSCYPLGKRMAENLCYSYFTEYKVPVKIARLSQTFGAGIMKEETRIFSQFARSVINNTDIILHTDGASTGNYCYTSDAMEGVFLLLLAGENGEIYNIANEDTCMTIRQMAELVTGVIAQDSITVKYDIPAYNQYGYAAPVKMRLSSEKIRNLGWKPQHGMVDMYHRMIAYMQEQQF